jgi:hypothetical protein
VRVTCVIGVLLTIALAGCYGSTEPATNVTPETAQLNGQGTANNGPASAIFRYRLVGDDEEFTTEPIHFPAGASGPFSRKVTGLAADSQYAFQLCGVDDGQDGLICANTRTFTTPPAVEDSLTGSYFSPCCYSWDVNAHAGPNGENARGSTRYTSLPAFSIGTEFIGFVTCLEVDGRSAAVGAVGQIRHLGAQPPASSWHRGYMLRTVVDGHFDPDTVGIPTFVDGTGSPDCGSASFASQSTIGSFVVNDATP